MSSRLGDLLQRRGDLTADQVVRAIEEQREHGGAVATHLVRLGFISEEQLLAVLQREYRLPVVDPLTLDIPKEVLALIPQAIVQSTTSSRPASPARRSPSRWRIRRTSSRSTR